MAMRQNPIKQKLLAGEPVFGPRFFVECEVRNQRGRMHLVETRFRHSEGTLLLFAITTIRAVDPPSEPGSEPG